MVIEERKRERGWEESFDSTLTKRDREGPWPHTNITLLFLIHNLLILFQHKVAFK